MIQGEIIFDDGTRELHIAFLKKLVLDKYNLVALLALLGKLS